MGHDFSHLLCVDNLCRAREPSTYTESDRLENMSQKFYFLFYNSM